MAGLITTSWVALWISLFLILGVLLIAHPIGLSTILPLDETIENGVGAAFLIAVGGLFIWLSRGARWLSYARFGFDLP